jgi:hypothetical protein
MKKKILTAQKLFDYLSRLKDDGNDLSKISVNYRYDDDSDVESCSVVGEDLFDEETNSILESIILKSYGE